MERFMNPNPDRARRSQTAVPEQQLVDEDSDSDSDESDAADKGED